MKSWKILKDLGGFTELSQPQRALMENFELLWKMVRGARHWKSRPLHRTAPSPATRETLETGYQNYQIHQQIEWWMIYLIYNDIINMISNDQYQIMINYWMMMFRFLIYQENICLFVVWMMSEMINSVGLAPAPAEPGENLEKLRILGENTSFHVTFHDMFHMKCSYEMFMSVVSLSPLLPCFNYFACSKGRTCWHAANRISFNDASMEHGVSCKIGCQCKLSALEHNWNEKIWEKSWVCLQIGYPPRKFHGLSSYQLWSCSASQ